MARPPYKPEDRRGMRLVVQLNETEKRALVQLAARRHSTMSHVAREAVLDAARAAR